MAAEEALNRIHVNNLAWAITPEQLQKHFEEFGEIETVKIPTRPKGGSKGFGFITFKTNEAAKNAVEKMNNTPVENRRIGVVFSTSVEKSKDKPKKPIVSGKEQESKKLVVRQLAWSVKDEKLEESFKNYGNLKEHSVVKARNGKSKGFGFVTFETVEQATAAKEAMDGKEIEGRAITVHFSNSSPRKKQAKAKKEEKTEEKEQASPKRKSKGKRKNRKKKGQQQREAEPASEEAQRNPKERKSAKLYVKISKKTETTVEDLTNVFKTYGALKKVEITKTKEGVIKGHAFITFENVEEASSALESTKTQELNGVSLATDYARRKRFNKRRRNPNNSNNDNNNE